ncbi:phage T7 F exclusion suppressor FxsA [Corynebacterium diphtheriae DSM 43988]|nr:phage T7 F exclusion suppressor FxsA [Corynebacterium diphtheriae DSM 43988]
MPEQWALQCPGFVTSIAGLLLIFTPTRALVRNLLAKKLRTKIEELGAKSFEATNAYRQQAHYGSFAQPNTSEVIDEEEIQSWTRNLKPEDFGSDDSGSNDSGRK